MKAITVENLSKVYSVATAQNQTMSFREMLASQVQSLFSKEQNYNPFYALKDVSFEVEKGEVLGIIGKNGSGKSTLLKILSRITAPSYGKAIVRGRVASLLEVGTGFHAELTGRENIFMSGVILGMKRWEINKHFDEIVAFAGVEKFIDIPVKKYSSGMRLRLAFSVAAHLQPEILLVDEVLAVGDYEFEQRCMQAMEHMTNVGRTILFVSHNVDMILRLCSRVLFLGNGEIQKIGNPQKVVSSYLTYAENITSAIHYQSGDMPGNEIIRLVSVSILNVDIHGTIYRENDLYLEIVYLLYKETSNVSFVLIFYDQQGNVIFSATECSLGDLFKKQRGMGKYISTCKVPRYIFNEGSLYITIRTINLGEGIASEPGYAISLEKALYIKVRSKQKTIFAEEQEWALDGIIRPQLEWSSRFY